MTTLHQNKSGRQAQPSETRKRVPSAFRKAAIGLTVGLLVGGSAGAAHATFTSSSVGAFTTNGRTYNSQATLETNGDGSAQSHISVQGGAVPSGWMYARGRSFVNGNFCDEAGWGHLTTTATTYHSNGVRLSCGYASYQSYGVVGAWNGNGYNYYYTFWTPAAYGG